MLKVRDLFQHHANKQSTLKIYAQMHLYEIIEYQTQVQNLKTKS